MLDTNGPFAIVGRTTIPYEFVLNAHIQVRQLHITVSGYVMWFHAETGDFITCDAPK